MRAPSVWLMLMPLDSSWLDSIAGLPLHPLVVHFAVVLLPLSALGLVLEIAVPKWADRFGALTLLVLGGGTGAAFIAKQSGEALAATVGEPATHAAWGDQLPWLAVGLLVLAGGWLLLHRAARKAGRDRSAAGIAVGLLTAVVALVVTGATIVVGHTGAAAAWGDVEAAQPADSTEGTVATSPASASPDAPQASPSASPSSAATGSYTMAEVAKHATAASCWTAIDGKVYNLTDWITRHPGGKRAILGLCGIDGSSAFNAQHGGQGRPAAELEQFLLGTLG